MAEAISTTITIDRNEIEDARWFGREEARLMLARTHPDGLTCPPRLAIANILIDAWAFGGWDFGEQAVGGRAFGA